MQTPVIVDHAFALAALLGLCACGSLQAGRSESAPTALREVASLSATTPAVVLTIGASAQALGANSRPR